MVFKQDILAIGLAALVVALLGGFMIIPSVYPHREPLGYVQGSIRSYEVSVTKYGGTTGLFNVRLDQGADLKVAVGNYATLVPGDRVCVRATRRGELVEGHLVSMDRCKSGS